MTPTDRCALEPLPTSSADEPRARILVAGRPTDVVVRANVLAAQFVCSPGYLVFANDADHADFPRILLLSPDGRLLDEVHFAILSSDGHLEQVRPTGPDELAFEYLYSWRLRVRRRPTRLPVNLLPLSVVRDRPAIAPRWLELRTIDDREAARR